MKFRVGFLRAPFRVYVRVSTKALEGHSSIRSPMFVRYSRTDRTAADPKPFYVGPSLKLGFRRDIAFRV